MHTRLHRRAVAFQSTTMTVMHSRVWFLSAALWIVCSTCHSQVSKCTDEKTGAVRYTDGPCPSQSRASTPKLTDNSVDASGYRRVVEATQERRRAPETQTATESPACTRAMADLDRVSSGNFMDGKTRDNLIRKAQRQVQRVCIQDATAMSPAELRELARQKESQAQAPQTCFSSGARWVSCGGRDYPLTEPTRAGNGLTCSLVGGFATCR